MVDQDKTNEKKIQGVGHQARRTSPAIDLCSIKTWEIFDENSQRATQLLRKAPPPPAPTPVGVFALVF